MLFSSFLSWFSRCLPHYISHPIMEMSEWPHFLSSTTPTSTSRQRCVCVFLTGHMPTYDTDKNLNYYFITRFSSLFNAQNGISPLHVAAKWGKVDVVILLVENKADVDCKTKVNNINLIFEIQKKDQKKTKQIQFFLNKQ